MPTPFMHLHIAEQIYTHLTHEAVVDEVVNGRLRTEWPAFYLGSIAPDVQTISGAPRSATHFYNANGSTREVADEIMLSQYPQLATKLPETQAIFMVGYMAHLLLDVIWLHDIVIPYFWLPKGLGDPPQRMLRHNILLTYLDQLAQAALPASAGQTLAQAHLAPEKGPWLPFVADQHLAAWQAMIVRQLQPGAPSETVAVYAERMNMTPAEFSAHLHDPAWMDERIFQAVPVPQIQARLQTAVPETCTLITHYLHHLY